MNDIRKNAFLTNLPDYLSKLLVKIPDNIFKDIEEIRLRAGKPMLIKIKNNFFFINYKGQVCTNCDDAIIIKKNIIAETLEIMSGYSLYAFQEEIRNGFLTLPGGHRVGIAGTTVVENGSVVTFKNISSLNIRLGHEIIGCSDKLLPYIINNNKVQNTLIISPPACGKTTLLRDIVKNLSNGFSNFIGVNVSVIDERSEIAGVYMGEPQNDIGLKTDIYDCCPKDKGIMLALRALSPSVIAVDEIGKKEDISSILSALNSGVSIICTMHGEGIEDLYSKKELIPLLDEKHFKRFIFLSNKKSVGEIVSVLDEGFNKVGEPA